MMCMNFFSTCPAGRGYPVLRGDGRFAHFLPSRALGNAPKRWSPRPTVQQCCTHSIGLPVNRQGMSTVKDRQPEHSLKIRQHLMILDGVHLSHHCETFSVKEDKARRSRQPGTIRLGTCQVWTQCWRLGALSVTSRVSGSVVDAVSQTETPVLSIRRSRPRRCHICHVAVHFFAATDQQVGIHGIYVLRLIAAATVRSIVQSMCTAIRSCTSVGGGTNVRAHKSAGATILPCQLRETHLSLRPEDVCMNVCRHVCMYVCIGSSGAAGFA